MWHVLRDTDNDGYGNPAVYVMSPAPPPGYVANAADCNDGNPSIHPGAPELCNNLKDDDCDGTLNEGCYTNVVVGVFISVDKFSLIAPWLSLIVLITAIVVSFVVWIKRRGI
jgi:hypothetical protein